VKDNQEKLSWCE